MGRKVTPTEQNIVMKNGDQIEYDTQYCQLPSPMHMVTSQSPMVASPAIAQPPICWMVAINVPYMNTFGQVNLNWNPSQDPMGKDLPISDINTLRYFFNLGVEYYRLASGLQQSQMQMMGPPLPPSQTPQPPPPPPPASMMTSEIMSTVNMQPQMDQGQCSSHQPNTKCNKCFSKNHIQANFRNDKSSDKIDEGSSSLLESDRDVDTYSLSQESGCLSDCSESLSPTKSEGQSENGDTAEILTPNSKLENGSMSHSDLLVEGNQEQSKSTKGKKKYYMYGSHKLVKPIKDIPPRFQTLLAEMSAAKLRCEGQLIYIQNKFDHETHLNVDASCFVPGNELPNSIPLDRFGNGTGSVSFIPCIMPPPGSDVNSSALPLIPYYGPHPPPPQPNINGIINKPPQLPVSNASFGHCPTCHLPVSASSSNARNTSSHASAANDNSCLAHFSGSSTNTTFSSPTTITSSLPVYANMPQNQLPSMPFMTPPPVPTNSALTSASAPGTSITYPPNIPALAAPQSVPSVLPPIALPSVSSANNAYPHNSAVEVSSHPLPGGGSYYIYHTSSSSTGFTASHSMSAQTPVYYVVSPSYAAAACGYQPGIAPTGYGVNMNCQAAAQ